MSEILGTKRFIFEPLSYANKDKRAELEFITDYDTGHVYVSDGSKVIRSKTVENENRHNAYFNNIGGANNMRVSVPEIASETIADALSEVYGHFDSISQGLSVKDSCKCATKGNIALSGLQTIDGYTVKYLDRVLVKDQTNPVENGVYVAASGTWQRAYDFNESSDVEKGAYTFIENGTTHDNSGWVMKEDRPTIGTDAITFQQFSGAGAINPHGKLYKNGNDLYMYTSGITAGTYFKTTYDQWGTATHGENPTTLAGFGIIDAVHKDREVIAGNGLTGGGTLGPADRTLAVNPGDGIEIVSDKVKVKVHSNGSIDNGSSGISINKATVQDYAGELITRGTHSNLTAQYVSSTKKINISVDDATVDKKGVTQLVSEALTGESTTKVPHQKAVKDGLHTKLNKWHGKHIRYGYTTGGVSNVSKEALRWYTGQSITRDDKGQFLVSLCTSGTSTRTGSVYVIYGGGSSSDWEIKPVYVYATGSNHPELVLENGIPIIKTSHNSYYNVDVIIEGYSQQRSSVYSWLPGIYGDHNKPTWNDVTGKPSDFNPNLETVQDIVGTMVTSGVTHQNISITYDDAAGKIEFAVNSASTQQKGVVQLTSAYDGESTTLAANQKALFDGLATKLNTDGTAKDSEKLGGALASYFVQGNGVHRNIQTDGLDINTVSQAGFYTGHKFTVDGRPFDGDYGSFIHIPFYTNSYAGSPRFAHQLAFEHLSNRVKIRSFDHNGDFNGDSEIYSESFKPTKADVGLGNLNNWTVATACTDGSTTKYVRASETKWLYDNKLDINGTAVNSQKLNNATDSVAATGSTIVKRDGDGNVATGNKLIGDGFSIELDDTDKVLSFFIS